jgi:hypothetical protein
MFLSLWRLRQHNEWGETQSSFSKGNPDGLVRDGSREDETSCCCTSTCLGQTWESGVTATPVRSFEGGMVNLELTWSRAFDAKKSRTRVYKVYRWLSCRTSGEDKVNLEIRLAVRSKHEESATLGVTSKRTT